MLFRDLLHLLSRLKEGHQPFLSRLSHTAQCRVNAKRVTPTYTIDQPDPQFARRTKQLTVYRFHLQYLARQLINNAAIRTRHLGQQALDRVNLRSNLKGATRLSTKRAYIGAAWRQVVAEKRDARGKTAAPLTFVETVLVDAAATRRFVKKLARRRKIDGDIAVFADLALVTAHAAAIADIVPRAVVPCAHRRYDALNGCRHGACAFPSSLIASIH